MSNDDKKGDGKKAEKKEKPPGPRFEIRVRANGFTRVHGPYNLRFIDSTAYTDDEKAAAHAANVCGYEVTDTKTDKVVNPLQAPESAESAK